MGVRPVLGARLRLGPDWVLTERQLELRELLIELCEREMRANAKRFDDAIEYPRRNLELLGEHGFLALSRATSWAGWARTTSLRDGRRDDRPVRLRLDGDVLGDAHRGGPGDHAAPDRRADRQVHPPAQQRQDRHAVLLRSRDGVALLVPDLLGAERTETGFRVRKKASWTTSAGFADFYVVQTTSPEFSGYDDLSVFVIDGDDAVAQPATWDAMGLRGNQSGPLEVPEVEIPAANIVGPVGDGAASNDESVDPWFLIGSSSVWNGLAMGAIDIAKRQTTRKRHVDVGLRVADYPTIQDYVGEAVMDTNACRIFSFSVAQAMDAATDHNSRVLAPGEFARATYLHWAWQIKFEAAKNTAHVVDKMLHAAAARATSAATWSWSATCATPRRAG